MYLDPLLGCGGVQIVDLKENITHQRTMTPLFLNPGFLSL
jgi:hypothetical protein